MCMFLIKNKRVQVQSFQVAIAKLIMNGNLFIMSKKILGLLQHLNTGSKRSVTHCSKLDIHRNRKFQHSDMKLREFYI